MQHSNILSRIVAWVIRRIFGIIKDIFNILFSIVAMATLILLILIVIELNDWMAGERNKAIALSFFIARFREIPDDIFTRFIFIGFGLIIFLAWILNPPKWRNYNSDMLNLILSIPAFAIMLLALSIVFQSIVSFSDLCTVYGVIDSKGQPIKDPETCLYFSFVTWTTLGYGDLVPTPELRIFAATEAFVGYISMSILVAGMISALSPRSNNSP